MRLDESENKSAVSTYETQNLDCLVRLRHRDSMVQLDEHLNWLLEKSNFEDPDVVEKEEEFIYMLP